MGLLSKKLRRRSVLKNAVAFVLALVSVSCLLVLLISVIRLPDVSRGNKTMGYYRGSRMVGQEENRLGKLGEMMIDMLPDDLAFTIFVPSEKAFWHDLKLRANDSLVERKENDDTYATLSRILGFSVVPCSLLSVGVTLRKELTLDSISGFRIYVSKEPDGSLLVNRVHSTRVDLKRRETVIHIMNGVIMDAEFEQSVRPDYEDGD